MIREIEEIIGLDCSNIIRASAKMGLGIEDTLEAIVQRIPPPKNTVSVSCDPGPPATHSAVIGVTFPTSCAAVNRRGSYPS